MYIAYNIYSHIYIYYKLVLTTLYMFTKFLLHTIYILTFIVIIQLLFLDVRSSLSVGEQLHRSTQLSLLLPVLDYSLHRHVQYICHVSALRARSQAEFTHHE